MAWYNNPDYGFATSSDSNGGSKKPSFWDRLGSSAKSVGSYIGSAVAGVGDALTGGLGSAAGAALNYYGARQANEANIAEAQKNRDFQERMSNTQAQCHMKDLSDAGLNPILAMNLGGGSPQGTTARVENQLAGSVSSAVDMRRASAEIANLRAQNDYIRAQTLLAKTQSVQSSAVSAKYIADAATSPAAIKAMKTLGSLLL